MTTVVEVLLTIAKFAPRGGFQVVRSCARHIPRLWAYPVELKLLPGTTMLADLRESVWYPLFKYGCYPHQVAEDRLALRFLRPGDCVWDIGANIGYTTLLFANAVGPSGYVVAVEPSRRAFAMLVRSVTEVAGMVHLIQAAASDLVGEVEFADAASLDVSSVVNGGIGAYRVPCITLDSLLAQPATPPPDFLKIDVEGHEIPALRGARRVISEFKPLIEFEALNEPARIATVEFLSAVGSGSYSFYRIRRDGLLVSHDVPPDSNATNNFLAVVAKHLERGLLAKS